MPGHFSRLPDEVVELALSFGDWGEWCAMGSTSRRYREVSGSDRLWVRDYDRMRKCVGCPDVSQGFRSVYKEGGFEEPQQQEEGLVERVKQTVSSTKAYFGRVGNLRLVFLRHPHINQRQILKHSPGVDLFHPGNNRVRQKFARCPMRVVRSVGEASGMIVTLQTAHPTLLALDLDAMETAWSERTSEIPILALLPQDAKEPYWGDSETKPTIPKDEWVGVSKRGAIDALRERLPNATFRVQECSSEGDEGVGKGMRWLIGAAEVERQRRDRAGVEPGPPPRPRRAPFATKN